jgi:hypothetical protein
LQPTSILGYIAAMSCPEDIASLSPEDLRALVAQLTASNQTLVTENEQLKRSVKRQAAPFSKGTRAQQPKRPGRKPGEGTFSSGKEAASRPPPPLRTGYESFPSSGSSRWAFCYPPLLAVFLVVAGFNVRVGDEL